MEQKEYKYDAFISYRHTELDKFVAEKVHRLLETFRVPRIANTTKSFKKTAKINRVFRDKDELPLGSNLADHITIALNQSKFLIVICSPRTPDSIWVQKEIETFISLHGITRILAVLIEGEPNESFPSKLRFIENEVILPDGTVEIVKQDIEPLAADIRGKNKKDVYRKLKKELLRLVAPIIGCSYDDLKQRHKERRTRRILITTGLAAAFFLLFGSFSTYQAIKIQKQSDKIETQSIQIQQSLNEQLVMQSNSLADRSFALLENGDRMRAILLAQTALPMDINNPDRPYVTSAHYALSKSLGVYENGNNLNADQILEHETNVAISKLSLDGNQIFTVDESGKFYLWDSKSGKLIRKSDKSISLPNDNSVFYINDQQIVYGSSEGVFCISTATFDVEWKKSDLHVSNIIISSDRKYLAVSSFSDIVILDSLTGAQIFSYIDKDGRSMGSSMSFSPDSSLLAVATTSILDTGEGGVAIFNLVDKTIKYTVNVEYTWITSMTFKNNDTLYVSSCDGSLSDKSAFDKGEGVICSFNMLDGQKLWEYKSERAYVQQLKLLNNNNLLAFVANDSLCTIFTSDGKINTIVGKASTISNYVPLGNDSALVLCATKSGDVSISELSNGFDAYSNMTPSAGTVKEVMFKKGLIAVLPYNSANLIIYKYNKGALYKMLCDANGNMETILSDSERYILLSGYDSSFAEVYDTNLNKLIGKISIDSNDKINKSYFINNDKNLLVIGNNHLYLYDVTTLTQIKTLALPEYSHVVVSPDNTLTAVVDSEKTNFYDSSLKEQFSIETELEAKAISSDNKYCLLSDSSKWAVLNNTTQYMEETDGSYSAFAVGQRTSQFAIIDSVNDELKIYNFDNTKQPKIALGISSTFVSSVGFFDNDSKLFVILKNNDVNIYDSSSLSLINSFRKLDASPLYCQKLKSSDNMIIYCSNKGYVINKDYEILAEIPNLKLVSKDCSTLYVFAGGTLGSLPLYDFKMLSEEAAKQLDGRTLTHSEKKEYFVK